MEKWKSITSLCFIAEVIKVVDGVELPSNTKRTFISFAQGPTLCFFAYLIMNVVRTDGNVLQYNDVADQFVVGWLGIVAIIIFLILEFVSEQPFCNLKPAVMVDVKLYFHTQARGTDQ